MQQKNVPIPRLSELVKYDVNNKVRSVNWEKFYQVYGLSKSNISKIKQKASRWLGYYVFVLSNKEILAQRSVDTYVISTNNSEGSIIDLKCCNIEYGFCREEDAEEFAHVIYQQKYPDIIITKYEEILFKNHREDYSFE